MEERIDKIIIERGLVSTRVRAEDIIRNHGVMVNGKLIQKSGKKVPVDAEIQLLSEEIPYVSRGALKLKHALDYFGIDVQKSNAIDVGASTGGFTEVLLEKGASKVYCVDVGTSQLHPSIREREEVINLEQTHVRELNNRLIPEACDIVVVDVSFISLNKVFPFLHPLVKPGAHCVALVKPQFEVGKENIGKGGIVKNKQLYPKVVHDIQKMAELNQFTFQNKMDSPILGGDGNKEFLLYFVRK